MKPINVFTVKTEKDPDDPAGYRAGAAKLGPQLGASMLGGSVYVLEPGESICPYHCEFGNEEWLLVLEGRPTLRRAARADEAAGGEVIEELEPGDTVCFPAGLEGAHKVTNDGESEARIFMFSTMVDPCMSYYPDSDKYGVWFGGGHPGFLVRRRSEVDYYDGE